MIGDMYWTWRILIKLRISLGIEGTGATKCNLFVDVKCIMIFSSALWKAFREADRVKFVDWPEGRNGQREHWPLSPRLHEQTCPGKSIWKSAPREDRQLRKSYQKQSTHRWRHFLLWNSLFWSYFFDREDGPGLLKHLECFP